jgi:Tfp pilus assembly protein PilN
VSPTFAINFRREAYQEEVARTRRRTVAVGTWVAYFGVVVLTLGLYGLNCASLVRRARLLEAQNARVGASHDPVATWKPAPSEMVQVEHALANPRRWEARLSRLAAVLPANVMLTSLAVNPDNMADPASQEKLVIAGVLKPLPGQDRMQGIMQLVAALRADAGFSAQYHTIKLLESRIESGEATAEFRIECR